MKKSYINPATAVVRVHTQKFIAASITTEGGEVKNVQMGGTFSGDASSVKSRGSNSLWDDEE